MAAVGTLTGFAANCLPAPSQTDEPPSADRDAEADHAPEGVMGVRIGNALDVHAEQAGEEGQGQEDEGDDRDQSARWSISSARRSVSCSWSRAERSRTASSSSAMRAKRSAASRMWSRSSSASQSKSSAASVSSASRSGATKRR